MADDLLHVLPRIAPTRVGTQVEHIGQQGQAILSNTASHIAGHPLRHGRLGAVGGLKLAVNQCFFPVEPDAEQAVHHLCLDGGLLWVERLDPLSLRVPQQKGQKALRMGTQKRLGNTIKFSHPRLSSRGKRGWREIYPMGVLRQRP